MNIQSKTILIVGDLILDRYIYGTSNRLSPEAPVPIINIDSSEYRLGGAGNVAANIRALGGNPVIIGRSGCGEHTQHLLRLLSEKSITYSNIHSTAQTTLKTRIIANKQQIARLDEENDVESVDGGLQCLEIAAHLLKNIEIGAIVVSDYSKGVITSDVFPGLVELARPHNIPVFLDPKIHHANYYTHSGVITAMTPNIHEAAGLTGNSKLASDAEIESAGRHLLAKFGCAHILITRGSDGISVFSQHASGISSDTAIHHLPTTAQDVFDVSGAGDTVIATLALAYASGMSILQAARLANVAAGIVVGKHGTATVTAEELSAAACNKEGC